MKFKHQNIIITVLLALLFLTACSKTGSKKTANLPTAKTILTSAEKTKFSSMHATWNELSNGKSLQKAEAQYTKKPAIIYANVSSSSNHYKMWIEGKSNYIQMKGTNSQRWFKTKLSKASAYGAITDNLNGTLLMPFIPNAKYFKVKQNGNDYLLTYKGNNKKIWNAIVSDSAFTALIGIDLDDVKPISNEIKINVDQNYDIKNVNVTSTYKDEGHKKNFTMQIDQINQVKKLTVPASIKKSAVDLGKINTK